MKKLIVIVLFFCFVFPVEAKTKQDIIDYVYDNAKCGTETAIFRSYNQTYTRLIKEKKLTDSEIEEIIKQLKIAYQIINKHNACRLSDIDLLSANEKETLFTALTISSDIVLDAPSLVGDQGGGQVVYDRETKTIDIYDREALVDRIEINQPKLTYTGPSSFIMIFLIIIIILVLINVIYYLFKKKFKNNLIEDLLQGLLFSGIILGFLFIGLGSKIKIYDTYKSLFRENVVHNFFKEIVLDETGQIIRYPAYGNHYGDLLIPNLGISLPIALGDSSEILKDYIGHYSASYFPGEGKEIIYSGHNSQDKLFNLVQIKIGAPIIVDASYGRFAYEVSKIDIIEDDDWQALETDGETLVLYTCYPFSQIIYGSKRFVVYADFIEKLGDKND